MFARKVDDGLASFAKRLDDLVKENLKKKAKGTVIMLAKGKDTVAPELEKIAQDKKLEQVPLTVAKDGESGPSAYSIGKEPVTVVVYDAKKKVTATFVAETLDAKTQAEALAAFAKVLGVDPPKVEPDKKDDAKKDEKKKAD